MKWYCQISNVCFGRTHETATNLHQPAIISEDEDFGIASEKLDFLIENIKEKTENHQILVFSSFVKMLQIIKTRLEEEHISFEYLNGETRDRQSRVKNF